MQKELTDTTLCTELQKVITVDGGLYHMDRRIMMKGSPIISDDADEQDYGFKVTFPDGKHTAGLVKHHDMIFGFYGIGDSKSVSQCRHQDLAHKVFNQALDMLTSSRLPRRP